MKNIIRNYVRCLKYAILPVSNIGAMNLCLDMLGNRRIMGGSFKGMRYIDTSHGSAYYPKILGTYEKELNSFWAIENLSTFHLIADIGCAEGYYLAGVAHVLSQHNVKTATRLLGYDINSDALMEASRLLKLNSVRNYELKTSGFESDFAGVIAPALLICDTEGEEREILDIKRIKALKRMHILVEVHDEPGRNDTLTLLRRRFLNSHKIDHYQFRERTLDDFPSIIWPRVKDDLKLDLMAEGRKYGKNWLYMVPK